MTLDTITAKAQKPRALRFLSVAAVATLALTACNADGDDPEANGGNGEAQTQENGEDAGSAGHQGEEGGAEASGTITVEDDYSTHEINLDEIQSVGAFDNRTFRILEEFGVELSVASRALMQPHVHEVYAEDEDILDTGNHREPNLELIVAADPDLVITGQRYAQYYEDISALLSDDAVILQFDEGYRDPATFFDNMKAQTEKLGQIFGEEETAQELVEDLEDALGRVEAAYNGEDSVMGLVTSGGDLNYAGPLEGRGVAPVFQEFGLVPALEVEDESSDHEGDDISVEAIADSNPDWIIVLDRDGMTPQDPEYTPAQELIADSPALQQVAAVQEERIVYMPQNMYITEDIQAYTEFLEGFADALEAAQ